MNVVIVGIKRIEHCTDCPFPIKSYDPDPDDWFCDDDMKLVCSTTNEVITHACRPHRLKIESNIPDSCPLLKLNG